MTTEDLTVTFVRTRDEALKERLAFFHSSKEYTRLTKYGFLFLWAAVFIAGLVFGFPYRSFKFSLDAQPDLLISIGLCAAELIPLSALIGFVLYRLLKSTRDNAIYEAIRRQPADAFGTRTVTISPNGLVVQAPLVRSEYNWKLVNSLRVVPEYIFFCWNSELITSIPTNALGDRQAAFLAEVNTRMLNSSTQASALEP